MHRAMRKKIKAYCATYNKNGKSFNAEGRRGGTLVGRTSRRVTRREP